MHISYKIFLIWLAALKSSKRTCKGDDKVLEWLSNTQTSKEALSSLKGQEFFV
jgi:hypothetical protein